MSNTVITKAQSYKDKKVQDARAQQQAEINTANQNSAQRIKQAQDQRAAKLSQANAQAAQIKAPALQKQQEANDAVRQMQTQKAQYQAQLDQQYNAALQQQLEVKIKAAQSAVGSYFSIISIPEASYQQLWQSMVNRGYRLLYFNGYDFKGATYFNVVFIKNDGRAWASFHNQSAQNYEARLGEMTKQGYVLVHVNSYLSGGSIRYAPVFNKLPTPIIHGGDILAFQKAMQEFQGRLNWTEYHGVALADHQNRFNTLTKQGYRLVNLSLSYQGGNFLATALYDKADKGNWVALANLSAAQYQTEFNNNTQQGRTIAYLQVASVNGTPSFSAIWNSTKYKSWAARHNLTSDAYHNEYMQWTSKGLNTLLLCGYQNGDAVNYAVLFA